MKAFLREHWLSIPLVVALGAFIVVHVVWYIHPSDVKSAEELEDRLNNGQPTVVEFYSNF